VAISTKLRWKRYINELRFVNEELDFVREISKSTSREFQIYYEDYCATNDINLGKLNQEHNDRIQKLYQSKANKSVEQDPQFDAGTDGALVIHSLPYDEQINSEDEEDTQQLSEYQMTQDEAEIHEAFNKVFRKLAMVLHPDKLEKTLTKEERDDKLKMFKESKAALEARKYFVLLDAAEKFNITTPRNYKQQIRWMKKETSKLNQELNKEKNTYNYIFSECESENEKDDLIKRFMVQLFGAKVLTNNT